MVDRLITYAFMGTFYTSLAICLGTAAIVLWPLSVFFRRRGHARTGQ